MYQARKPAFWYYGSMKTTLELPDDLMRAIKLRAVREDRKLKDLIAELLRRGLTAEPEEQGGPGRRVQLPILHGGHEADRDEEMTPDRVAELLIEQEVGGAQNR